MGVAERMMLPRVDYETRAPKCVCVCPRAALGELTGSPDSLAGLGQRNREGRRKGLAKERKGAVAVLGKNIGGGP